MKATAQHREIAHYGETPTTSSFTVKNGSKLFHVLSTNFYKRAIDACVREIACNAYDSHREAGQTRPFDLHIPTVENPTFIVRDYGTGIDPDQINSIYTTYLESTKDQSSDDIGGWGLGTKAPFAYASVFQVVNYWNGTAYFHTAYMDKDGPKFELNGSSQTAEPNGVEVSVGVKLVDLNSFKTAAKTSLRYFQNKPNLTGDVFEWDQVSYSRKSDRWGIETRGGNAVAVMGNVSYPIDIDLLGQSYPRLLKGLPQHLTIEFDIDEIAMMPTREELSYDPTTAATLNRRITEITREIESEYKAEVKRAPSFYAACMIAREFYVKYRYIAPPIKFDGREVGTTVANYDKFRNASGKIADFIDVTKAIFLVGDETKAVSRAKSYNQDNKYVWPHIYVVKSKNAGVVTGFPRVYRLGDFEPLNAPIRNQTARLQPFLNGNTTIEKAVAVDTKGIIILAKNTSYSYYHYGRIASWLEDNGHENIFFTAKRAVYDKLTKDCGWACGYSTFVSKFAHMESEYFSAQDALIKLKSYIKISTPDFDIVRETYERLAAIKPKTDVTGLIHYRSKSNIDDEDFVRSIEVIARYPILKYLKTELTNTDVIKDATEYVRMVNKLQEDASA